MGRGPGGRGGPPSFEELDVDGDGFVSETEFVAPMLEHGQKRFAGLDADGSGSLTEDELSAGGRRGRGAR